jgi:serine protease AprX
LRLFFIILFFLFQHASAQEFKYLVRFKDKKNNGFDLSAPGSFLAEKSIQRRQKQHIGFDSTDLPLTQAYVDSISAVPSVHILNKSRWFNQLLISIPDTTLLQQITRFGFVVAAMPVNNNLIKKTGGRISVNSRQSILSETVSENTNMVTATTGSYEYGYSFPQIHIHNGEFLHNLGFHGESMTIAILDDGFNNYLNNPAFETMRNEGRILGTYDYVNLKTSVNEEDVHGADCFSIIAANVPGTMVGTAPAANYWLFKTEDINSESPVEEQNWVAAAEFADSVGADLITTSLGYDYFDDSVYNLNYAERNGHTALVTKAANFAVAKGMIVTASAGNSGYEISEKKYVICPADGDSVYAVGSVDFSGQIAGSSSWGPNASGQIKPDGVSVGSGTFFIGPDGTINSGSGTSFANPNLAGLIVCLWQAFPEFNSSDIRTAVHLSSNLYNNPNNRYGYGLPDFEKAYGILLNKRLVALNQLAGGERVRVFPVPFHQTLNIFLRPSVTGQATIQLMDVSGKIFQTETVSVVTDQQQLVNISIRQALSTGVYFIRYTDTQYSTTLKLMKNQ